VVYAGLTQRVDKGEAKDAWGEGIEGYDLSVWGERKVVEKTLTNELLVFQAPRQNKVPAGKIGRQPD